MKVRRLRTVGGRGTTRTGRPAPTSADEHDVERIEFDLEVACPVRGRVDFAGATGPPLRVALPAGVGDVLNELRGEMFALLLLGAAALASLVATCDRLVALGFGCDARVLGRASVLERPVDVALSRRRCLTEIPNLPQGMVPEGANLRQQEVRILKLHLRIGRFTEIPGNSQVPNLLKHVWVGVAPIRCRRSIGTASR